MIITLFDKEIDSDIYVIVNTEETFRPTRSVKLTLRSADEKLILVFEANGEPRIQQILDAKELLLAQPLGNKPS